MLENFYKGENVNFDVTITSDGSNPDITSDAVKLTIKQYKSDSDANAKLVKNADVSGGTSGVATFTLTDGDTEIDKGIYYYDIVWYPSSGGEYVVNNGYVEVMERVSD